MVEIIFNLQHDAGSKVKMATKWVSVLKKICIITENYRNTFPVSESTIALFVAKVSIVTKTVELLLLLIFLFLI